MTIKNVTRFDNEEVPTWQEMKELLCGIFLPINFTHQLCLKFDLLSHGDWMLVREYTTTTFYLTIRSKIYDDPEVLVVHYVADLNHDIRDDFPLLLFGFQFALNEKL